MVKVYSILDVKSDTFSPPFIAPTNGVATRMFFEIATDGQSTIAKHPEDFKLVLIGEFDDASGDISAVAHVSLGFATEYIPKKE